ncbi:MAG TPA: hypothetical protein VIO11_00885, partial [Candidatus Methanoperedens sp.]
FILVSLDVYKQKDEISGFRIAGTPTEVFLNPDGTEITRIRGYIETGSFLYTINEIMRQKEALK